MAVMTLDKRMVFWKILVYETDATSILSPYISKITIDHTILPRKGKREEEHKDFPSKASITIISKDYLEFMFIEGATIKIYMGYDRILTAQDLVFDGTIMNFPDGEAEDMLKYTVIAYGGDIELILKERNKSFLGKNKNDIVREIMSRYSYGLELSMPDSNIIKGEFAPSQLQQNDLSEIQTLAEDWGCVAWVDHLTGTFYMVDSTIAHRYNGKKTYILGYRTDKVPCNVAHVSWEHEPNRSATSDNPGVIGMNEDGVVTDPDEFKIVALGKTWKLKPQYMKVVQDKKNPLYGQIVGFLTKVAGKYTFKGQGYTALKTFYRPVNDDDSTKPRTQAHHDSGWKIKIKLNDGDPSIYPPIHASLYYGSINPRADSSMLPYYLAYYSDDKYPYINLRVNETTLSYSKGKMDTELTCSIGMFD